MTSAYIPRDIQIAVLQRANSHCEYCLSDERLVGIPFEIEHILPLSRSGETVLDNLALACSRCNRHKANRTHVTDPLDQKSVSLFNPRQQKWGDHFSWSDEGVLVTGLTDIGRATVEALQMNHPLIIEARRNWIILELQPPSID
ncbi:MAG: HNH endonuclease [Chloroflexi bacterium]|nr:HNH endonuclease [Chloroflexota bacterium]